MRKTLRVNGRSVALLIHDDKMTFGILDPWGLGLGVTVHKDHPALTLQVRKRMLRIIAGDAMSVDRVSTMFSAWQSKVRALEKKLEEVS